MFSISVQKQQIQSSCGKQGENWNAKGKAGNPNHDLLEIGLVPGEAKNFHPVCLKRFHLSVPMDRLEYRAPVLITANHVKLQTAYGSGV